LLRISERERGRTFESADDSAPGGGSASGGVQPGEFRDRRVEGEEIPEAELCGRTGGAPVAVPETQATPVVVAVDAPAAGSTCAVRRGAYRPTPCRPQVRFGWRRTNI
jgi:hypothetical protein